MIQKNYGLQDMLPGQMLPGQMSPWQLASVKDGPMNLSFKFGQNQVSNSWDIPYMDKCCLNKYHRDNGVGLCSMLVMAILQLVSKYPSNLRLVFIWNNVCISPPSLIYGVNCQRLSKHISHYIRWDHYILANSEANDAFLNIRICLFVCI